MTRAQSCPSGLFWLAGCLFVLVLAACRSSPPPAVESTDPPYLEQGVQDVDVTIRGAGFDPNSRVRIRVSGTDAAGGVTVNSTRYVDARTLISNVDVAPDAATGVFDVEVEAGGRTGKGVEVFGVVAADQRSAE